MSGLLYAFGYGIAAGMIVMGVGMIVAHVVKVTCG